MSKSLQELRATLEHVFTDLDGGPRGTLDTAAFLWQIWLTQNNLTSGWRKIPVHKQEFYVYICGGKVYGRVYQVAESFWAAEYHPTGVESFPEAHNPGGWFCWTGTDWAPCISGEPDFFETSQEAMARFTLQGTDQAAFMASIK